MGLRSLFAGVVCAGLAVVVAPTASSSSADSPAWSINQQFPAPSGDLTGIACWSSSDCIAVGSSVAGPNSEAPAIATTTNGGTSWNEQSAGESDVALKAVSCPAASDCYAVGGVGTSGTIVATTNGGATWTPQSIPNGDAVSSIACPSISTCFAASGKSVLATTNSGATWSAQALSTSVLAISCPSTTTCMAIGYDTETSTTDGGTTWSTPQPIPGSNLLAIDCPSSSNCHVVGANGGSIDATTNAGTSWSSQTLPSGAGDLAGVTCTSATACFATGQAGTDIIATTDGTTWTNEPLSGSVLALGGITCPSTSECLAVGASDLTSFQALGSLVSTANTGTSWTESLVDEGLAAGLSSISCASSTDCVSVGLNTAVSTTDASSWTVDSSPTPGVPQLHDLVCTSSSDCLAVGTTSTSTSTSGGTTSTGAIDATTNGGTSWSAQNVPTGISSLLSIACPSSSICFAGGYGVTPASVMLLSTNGGSTWTPGTLPSGTTSGIGSIACPSVSVCYAGADSTTGGTEVLATTDGGASWSPQSLPSGASAITAITCTSTSVCFALVHTNGGAMLAETTNSGSNWSSTTIPNPTELFWEGIACWSSGDCIATGYNDNVSGFVGVALITTDGGTSWTSQTLPAGTTIPGPISCPAANTCFAAAGQQILAYGATAAAAGGLTPLTPARILDTRSGTGSISGPVGSGHSISLNVLGVGGVPASGVSAVVLNVTATAPSANGYLTVYPDGASRPTTSNLNFSTGQTVPNLVIATVGSDGKVDFYNGSSGTVQVVADVSGWFASGAAAAGGLTPLTPARILDTRSGTGGISGPVGSGHSISLNVLGVGGVPASGVSAVVLNVTATAPSANGYLTVYPDGASRPTTSNLNFSTGETVPNLVIAPVGSDGKVDFYNGSSGTVQVVADVSGWFASGAAAAGGLTPLTPARILDTRSGTGGISGPVGSGHSISLNVLGVGGVPASGVSAVVLNVTATAPSANGYLTVYPDGASRPTTSNLNFSTGETVPNLVIAPVGSDGKVDFYNGSSGTVQVVADVSGWVS